MAFFHMKSVEVFNRYRKQGVEPNPLMVRKLVVLPAVIAWQGFRKDSSN